LFVAKQLGQLALALPAFLPTLPLTALSRLLALPPGLLLPAAMQRSAYS